MRKILSFIVAVFFTTSMFAQTTVKGAVVDANSQPIPGVSVKIANKAIGTVTDFDGNYILKTDESPVFTIEFISMGFTTQTAEVTAKNQTINVTMEESTEMLDEVVMSASRTPERIMETPVTIERMGLAEIKATSAPNFYDGLENMKGVQMNKNSLTFQSVNTRGFTSFSNSRFVQLIDGMDNSSPALNFPLGNLVGISELDLQSIEILPGASSALYGANAFNGILFMNSKNPFDHEGASAYVKGGITSQKAAGDNLLYDVGARYAQAGDKFAFKLNVSVLQGEDWHATDYTNKGPGLRGDTYANNPGYEGVNVYGDEVATIPLPNNPGGGQYTIQQTTYGALAANPTTAPFAAAVAASIPAQNFYISRTGYKEEDLTDNKASTTKADFGLYFRPKGRDDDFEVSVTGRYGIGSTIYQGSNRYALRDLMMSQVKLEIKDKNYFLRGYTTIEDAGDSYDMVFTGVNINRMWKPDATWFPQYTGDFIQTYTGAYLGMIPGVPAGNAAVANSIAHQHARATADAGRYVPGTAAFDTAYNQVIADSDFQTGSKFIDKTQSMHFEGNYNFSEMLDGKFEFQIGGSYRNYNLNSEGTIFTDTAANGGAIKYGEYGAYAQIGKKIFDERLKLRASLRMDKQDDFDQHLSPRISAVYSAGDHKQHNFRASFQTGFRNPTTQDLYIGLNIGAYALVGSSPANLDRYTETLASGDVVTGQDAYYNAYTLESVRAFSVSHSPPDLVKSNYGLVKAEEVKAYEIGYRGKIANLNVDVNWYKNAYTNFMTAARVVSPGSGSVDNMSGVVDLATGNVKVFQLYTNSKGEVTSQGFGLGLSTKVGKDFKIGFSWDRNTMDIDNTLDAGLTAGFNTAKNSYKFSFGKNNPNQKVGFKVDYKWQDAYFYEASFGDAVTDARVVMDAQVNYKIPAYKTTIKLGGSNILGDEYTPAIGTAAIGSIYYLSLTYNN
jgi:outer membrane cobalamin receptor